MAVSASSIVYEMHSIDGESTWVDITDDARQSPPVIIEYGIRSSEIEDRTATSGTMRFSLDNTVANSGGLQGYYSPDNANLRTGFAIGRKTRLTINYSGSAFVKYVGWLDSIQPAPGKYKSQDVSCVATDWMDVAARYSVNADAPAYEDYRADQSASKLINLTEKQPESLSFEQGQDTFTYSLDAGRANVTTILRELQKLAQSELGYFYQRGGVLVFEDRHFRLLRTSASATLNDDMIELVPKRDRVRVRNIIRTITHPRSVDTGASNVLFTLDYTPGLNDSQSIVITGEYKDPDNANRPIGGINVKVPVPGTDYVMNTQSTGTGTDLTYDQKGRILATCPNNLAAYWPLADAAGTTTVEEITDYYGNKDSTACAVTFGVTGIGDGRTAASFDAASSYINTYSACFSNQFSGSEGGIGCWGKVSASTVWGDSASRMLYIARVDSNNQAFIRKSASTNTLLYTYQSGGCRREMQYLCGSPTDYFQAALTWNNGASKAIAYYNGASVASSLSWVDPWQSGSLVATENAIGAYPASAQLWDGSIAHVWCMNKTPAASDILNIYNAGSGGFNVDSKIGGFAAEYTITNQSGQVGYVTTLQIRGDRIKDYQPVTQEEKDDTSVTNYGELVLNWDMPYQEDPLVGKDAADFFLLNLKDPTTQVERIKFNANHSDDLMKAALRREPGDRITITETVTGINADFFINGVRLTIKPNNIIDCEWFVIPAKDSLYWSIGEAGYSEIGETTYVTY